ncbi:LysE family translocator [Vibrio methylphosphonaticus]|uniref:LysE family translocator n=1 Tax=Vibrio methylphosphonaticus TaxID=2946866 RepID=UPI00202A01D9|nr:LysE family translocator [Vibrio methylphosphonaticus]MCL9774781.1 LysE family translocator [Vibrio methylphosphonaticus]
MDYLLTVVLFAVSASVTPGPNNILVMTSGVNFGVKKSLPLLFGICVGFTMMLLLVGVGFSQLFERFPNLHFVIKCIGVFYLLYLAYLIASSSSSIHSEHQNQPLSFMKGAIFQWFNAKAWVVATGAIAAFTTTGSSFLAQNIMIAITFFVVSFPCVGLWLVFGSLLKNILNSPKHRKWFNLVMSGLLILSVYPIFLEITQEIT